MAPCFLEIAETLHLLPEQMVGISLLNNPTKPNTPSIRITQQPLRITQADSNTHTVQNEAGTRILTLPNTHNVYTGDVIVTTKITTSIEIHRGGYLDEFLILISSGLFGLETHLVQSITPGINNNPEFSYKTIKKLVFSPHK
jgi:hypothetical protein